jgi:hypothetical protein
MRRMCSACCARAASGHAAEQRDAEQRDEVAPTDLDCPVTLPLRVMPMQWKDDTML